MKNLKLSKIQFKSFPKDKAFNIATICAMVGTIILSQSFELGSIADIAAPIVFFTLSAMNKVTFENGIFVNSQGDDLSGKLPTKFGEWLRVIALITFFGLIMGLIPLGYNLIASLFTITISYFLFSNCPMSILLNNEAWQQKEHVFGIKPLPANYEESKLFKNNSSPNITTDPSYRYLSINVHNRNYR